MKLKLLKGKLKEDDGKPLKPGESVFSGKTWAKLIAKAKNKDEKELLKVLKAEDKRATKSKSRANA